MELGRLHALRRALHGCPERSGQEERTRAMLMEFLSEHTTLELRPCGAGFYAAHREEGGPKPPVALRADYDALALPGGGAAHLCGHDGHAAALCGAALSVEGERLGRNVFFLPRSAGMSEKSCRFLPQPVFSLSACRGDRSRGRGLPGAV